MSTVGGEATPPDGLQEDCAALHALIMAWAMVAGDVVGGTGGAEEMESRRLCNGLETAVRKRLRSFVVVWGRRGRV